MTSEQRKIIHLLNRAGFGPSSTNIEQLLQLSLNEVIDYLFESSKEYMPLKSAPFKRFSAIVPVGSKAKKFSHRRKLRIIKQNLNFEWLQKMAFSKSQLREKMAFFWHDHFACGSNYPALIQMQINTIRENSLEYFGDLVLNIAKDPAMINYLNNNKNVKNNPNENFGRELLELFTLGVGNYSEKDIKEAARAFTGWRFRKRTGEFYIKQELHDNGKKTFLGKTDYFNGEDIIQMIFENPRSGEYIVEKIYFFLTGKVIAAKRKESLSKSFYNSNYHIGTLVKAILSDDDFYTEDKIGTRVKSPIELLVGIMRITQIQFDNAISAIKIQQRLGQELFKPPNVSGWPSGRAWLDLSTISERLNLSNELLLNKSIRHQNKTRQISTESIELEIDKGNEETKVSVNLKPIMKLIANTNQGKKAERLMQILYPASHLNLNNMISRLNNKKYIRKSSIQVLLLRLLTQPEYQLN